MRPLIDRAKQHQGRRRKRKPVPVWTQLLGAWRWRAASALAVAVVAIAAGLVFAAEIGAPARERLAAEMSRIGEALSQAIGRAGGLQVARIEVDGRGETPAQDVMQAIGVTAGDPILTVNLEETRQRVEALAWVKRASVRRQLPDTLHIQIEERQPFALWQRQGRTALIDREGKILAEPAPQAFLGLPLLVGEGAVEAAAELFDFLSVEPELARHLVSANWIRARRWDLEFDSGILVRMPEQDPGAAFARLAEIERQDQIFDRDIRIIDLRFADRVVVRLMPEAAAARRLQDQNG